MPRERAEYRDNLEALLAFFGDRRLVTVYSRQSPNALLALTRYARSLSPTHPPMSCARHLKTPA